MPFARFGMPTHNGCIHGRRHVPRWLQVRQWVLGAEQAGDQVGWQETGIASTHVRQNARSVPAVKPHGGRTATNRTIWDPMLESRAVGGFSFKGRAKAGQGF